MYRPMNNNEIKKAYRKMSRHFAALDKAREQAKTTTNYKNSYQANSIEPEQAIKYR